MIPVVSEFAGLLISSRLVLKMLVMCGSFGKSLPTKGITHYTPDICNTVKRGSCSVFIAELHSAQ